MQSIKKSQPRITGMNSNYEFVFNGKLSQTDCHNVVILIGMISLPSAFTNLAVHVGSILHDERGIVRTE